MTLTRQDRRLLLAATVVAVGAFAMSAGYQFVYDDVHIIQNKDLLHSLANWREILASTWWGYSLYRPLTEMTFAVDWAVGHGDPRVFHAINLLLHAGVTALVYLLARRGLGAFGAGTAALLFAVHPVHVEAVANIVGRAEVLATGWTLLALLAYARDGELAQRGIRSGGRWVTSLGTLAATACALASKESAFAVPGALLLVDWLEARRVGEPTAERVRRHWVLWVACVVLSIEWLWLRAGVLGELAGDHPAAGLEGEGIGGRLWVMAPVVLQYLRLLFFPLRLSADYSPDFLPTIAAPTVAGVIGLLLLAGLIVLAIRGRRRAPPIAFGLAWIGGTLLVVANLIVPTGVLLAERTLYMPSVGAVIILGWIAAWAEASWRHAGVAFAALGVGLGMARTLTREPVWRDANTFFPRLVRDAPGSYRSFWTAGALSFDAGDAARGEALFRHGLQIYPLHPQMWETLAAQLAKQRRWLDAAQAYRASFSLDSTRMEGAARGVDAFLQAGMMDSAEALVHGMALHDAEDLPYQTARAEIAAAQGRPLEAMTWRRRVAWQFPNEWPYWFVTAQAALDARYCWEARRSVHRVQVLKPDAPHLGDLQQRLKEAGCEP